MPHFSERVFHMGGVPVGGDIPVFLGNSTYPVNYYYVDQLRAASGGGSGSFKDPYSTIAAAVTAANATIDWSLSPWAPWHVIVIAPGTYAENITSLPYGCTLWGLGFEIRDAQAGVKIKPASGDPVDVNACINTHFANICFESPGSGAAFDAAICNNNVFWKCRFSGAAESVTCAYAFYTNDSVGNKWLDCDFTCAAIGFEIAYADGGDSFSHNLIEHCRFSQHTTAGIRTSTNLVGPSSLVNDCNLWGGGQTLAIGVDDNSGILELADLDITATDPVQGCRAANRCYGNGALLDTTGE